VQLLSLLILFRKQKYSMDFFQDDDDKKMSKLLFIHKKNLTFEAKFKLWKN